MKDLVSIAHKGITNNLPEEERKRNISDAILRELKQMPEEEFALCFTSASANVQAKEYEVILRFNVVLDEA